MMKTYIGYEFADAYYGGKQLHEKRTHTGTLP